MFKLVFFAGFKHVVQTFFTNAGDKVYIDPLLIPNPFINCDITSPTRTSYYKISHETLMRLKESKLPRAEKEKRHVSIFASFLKILSSHVDLAGGLPAQTRRLWSIPCQRARPNGVATSSRCCAR